MTFVEAMNKVANYIPVTREAWTKSRILRTDEGICIQHDVTVPGVTPWKYTPEDAAATDYVLAHFNHRDTTQSIYA